LLPPMRFAILARLLLDEQPDPPRRVGTGDLIGVYGPFLLYGLVLCPIVAALAMWFRTLGWLPGVFAAAVITFVVVVAFMASTIARAKRALQNGALAHGEVISAGRLEGQIRVDIAGRPVETLYRFQRFVVGTRVGVLVDPGKQTVLLPIGISLP
jgi:hypothetical protein